MQVSHKILVSSEKGQTKGELKTQAMSLRQARGKGIIGLFCCWGLALLTLPIPLVHFVATPMLVLLGPVVGFAVFKLYKNSVVMSGTVKCPDCPAEVSIPARAVRFPFELNCRSCGGLLKVSSSNA